MWGVRSLISIVKIKVFQAKIYEGLRGWDKSCKNIPNHSRCDLKGAFCFIEQLNTMLFKAFNKGYK